MRTVTGETPDRVRAAAEVWSAATAARDGNDVVPPAAASIPILRAVLDGAGSPGLVTIDDDDITRGFAVYAGTADGALEVAYLGVSPAAWGRGVARQLLGAVEAEARARSCRYAELWVYADNDRAVAVYEANGWSRDGETRMHPRSGRVEQRHRLTL